MTLQQLLPKLKYASLERARELLQLHFPTHDIRESETVHGREIIDADGCVVAHTSDTE